MYTTKFTVRGTGAFPMDMLRYDCAYPARTQDAMEIALSLARGSDAIRAIDRHPGGTPYEVTLIRTHRSAKGGKPTEGRWESFGWTVTSVHAHLKVG
jgi:hypothetical protein